MAFCQGLFLSCHVYGAPYSTQDYCGCHKIIKMMLKKTVCTNQFNSKVINILTSRLSLIIIKVNLFQEAKLKTLIWSSSLSCIGETANEKNVHLKIVALRSNKDDLYLKKKKKITWGSLEVNRLWYCKLLFPQGQDIASPRQLWSESWSVTGGGSQGIGRWTGRS